MPGKPKLAVIGSINMDLVVRAPSIPRPGQTVIGDELRTIPGGKGANQAVAAARLGAECSFIGAVGDDPFGRRMIDELSGARVDTQYVRQVTSAATGAALITVDPSGVNAICVAGGANRLVSPEDVDRAVPVLRTVEVCLLQLEIPLETTLHAIRVCRDLGIMSVLDATPAMPNPPEALFGAGVFTSNLDEAIALTGIEGDRSETHTRALIQALKEKGCGRVVLKLGERGASVFDEPEVRTISPHEVEVVDTTAAGDAFNAALGVALASKCDLFAAARRANAAGALACTVFGAMPAMPTQRALKELLEPDRSAASTSH